MAAVVVAALSEVMCFYGDIFLPKTCIYFVYIHLPHIRVKMCGKIWVKDLYVTGSGLWF